MREPAGRRWQAASLFALVFFGHAWFVGALGWNQTARIGATLSFVEPGPNQLTLRIDARGDTRGLPTGDWALGVDGHYYSNKAPGVSLIGVPAYALIFVAERSLGLDPRSPLLTRWNSIFLNLWCSIAWTAAATTLLFVHLGAAGLRRDEALLGALAYAFGTLAFPYDTSIWGHTTAAACLLGALCLVWWPGGMRRPELAGALGGLALLVEYSSALPLAAIGVALLGRSTSWRQRLAFAAGALPPVVLLLVYQHLAFGNFLVTAPSRGNPVFHDAGASFGGVIGAVQPAALLGLTFSPWRGLFLYSPVLLFAALGGWQQWRVGRRALVATCAAGFLATLLFVASFNAWWGGWANGPRYLIVAIPLLAILTPRLAELPRPVRVLHAAALLVSTCNMLALSAVEVMMDPAERNPLYGLAYRTLATGGYAAGGDTINLGRLLGLAPPWDLAAFVLLFGGAALRLLRSTRAAVAQDRG